MLATNAYVRALRCGHRVSLPMLISVFRLDGMLFTCDMPYVIEDEIFSHHQTGTDNLTAIGSQ